MLCKKLQWERGNNKRKQKYILFFVEHFNIILLCITIQQTPYCTITSQTISPLKTFELRHAKTDTKALVIIIPKERWVHYRSSSELFYSGMTLTFSLPAHRSFGITTLGSFSMTQLIFTSLKAGIIKEFKTSLYV